MITPKCMVPLLFTSGSLHVSLQRFSEQYTSTSFKFYVCLLQYLNFRVSFEIPCVFLSQMNFLFVSSVGSVILFVTSSAFG